MNVPTYTLLEGANNEATIRATFTTADVNGVVPNRGRIIVPSTYASGGSAGTCQLDTLDLSGGLDIIIEGTSPFDSVISITHNSYINCQGSRVQFRNLRIVGGTTAKAGAVFCRAQSNGAGSRNQCGFWNCILDGTYSVAPIVNYGMELFTLRDCQIYNSYDGGLSYTVSFNPDQLTPFGYSANFTGHTNSGNCIDNCYIYHYGGATGTAGIPLVIGDQTTELEISAWLGGTNCPTLLDVVKYTPAYGRLRAPQHIHFSNYVPESGTALAYIRADDPALLREVTLPQKISPNTLKPIAPGRDSLQRAISRKIKFG